MNPYFPEIKKNFGFGCMRLPMQESEVDLDEMNRMVDLFLEKGFNYFDTAHMYVGGKSETSLKSCLTSRYPRDAYILTNKLSSPFFKTEEEIRPLFESQLEACGVDYFDFYLMHSMGASSFEKFKKCRAFEIALELKAEGKVRHVGFSFHDTPEVLDRILTEYPQMEAVQIQFNYADMEDPTVRSRECYEVCRKHGKPVIIMEPVKGGSLVRLPDEAAAAFSALGTASPASYAIRYAAGFEGVMMVLSGMSNLEQMQDNLSYMQDFRPLEENELAAVEKVRAVLDAQNLIPCTACRYCTDGCPMEIDIPELFADRNTESKGWDGKRGYMMHTRKGGKASDCIECGQCEDICPQHLPIRELLREVAETFEG